MEKTLREFLKMQEIQKNLSLLEGKSFSDAHMLKIKEDRTVYTLEKVWREGRKLLADYDECDFGMYGMSTRTKKANLKSGGYLLDCEELIEGVNAQVVSPMAFGTSI